jgi:hypothetical protein
LTFSVALSVATPEGDSKERSVPSLKRWPDTNLLRRGFIAGTLAMVALSYGFVLRAQPLCFTEAWVNSRTRLALESSVVKALADFPRDSRYLMYVGEHVGALQQAGIPLRQVVNEGNHRPWRKPTDAEGFWEQALRDPTQHVDFVIAYEGDAVDQSVEKSQLVLLTEIHTVGQSRARIYSARPTLNQSR